MHVRCRPALCRRTGPEVGDHIVAKHRRKMIDRSLSHCRCKSLDINHIPPIGNPHEQSHCFFKGYISYNYTASCDTAERAASAAATIDSGRPVSCTCIILPLGLVYSFCPCWCHSFQRDSRMKSEAVLFFGISRVLMNFFSSMCQLALHI